MWIRDEENWKDEHLTGFITESLMGSLYIKGSNSNGQGTLIPRIHLLIIPFLLKWVKFSPTRVFFILNGHVISSHFWSTNHFTDNILKHILGGNCFLGALNAPKRRVLMLRTCWNFMCVGPHLSSQCADVKAQPWIKLSNSDVIQARVCG